MWSFTLQATNYFVSNADNNFNNGLTLNNALQTLQHTSDQVAAGDTVFVEDGTYVGFDHRNVSGTANAPIVFSAMGDNVLISSTGCSTDVGYYFEDSDFIIIDGFMVNDILLDGDGIRFESILAIGRL